MNASRRPVCLLSCEKKISPLDRILFIVSDCDVKGELLRCDHPTQEDLHVVIEVSDVFPQDRTGLASVHDSEIVESERTNSSGVIRSEGKPIADGAQTHVQVQEQSPSFGSFQRRFGGTRTVVRLDGSEISRYVSRVAP